VQRVERDREDQRPDHQGQKRRENLEAEHRQRKDEAGADQHIEHARVCPAFELALDR
jgi:hypothetical protein